MTVIVAQDNPDAIRGVLKRWFIEPKPNVFVASINSMVVSEVIKFIRPQAKGIRLLIISSSMNCQGYDIRQINDPSYSTMNIDGIELISTCEAVDCPF